jgi:predicted AAA+ superfamily ATPase
MQNKHQKFGEKSENLAVWYLKKNGYKILEQNYRNRMGEIDIIAKEKKTLVFVEVKSRRSIGTAAQNGRLPPKNNARFPWWRSTILKPPNKSMPRPDSMWSPSPPTAMSPR